jgi:hypothetical protein
MPPALLLQETAGNMLEGLHVALEHPAVSTDPHLLCTAAIVSKSWRQAVQQCRACNTTVLIDAAAPMARLQSFAQWLARHAGLVKSLSMERSWKYGSIDGLPYKAHEAAAQELLQLSIHAVGAPPADSTPPSPAAAAAAATAATPVMDETQEGNSQQQ